MSKPLAVYVSGAIAGKPDGNKLAFAKECAWLLQLSHHDYPSGKDVRFLPINPHNIKPWVHGSECPEGYASANGHSSACFLRADLLQMLQCDVVLMLEDWENSKGANLERTVAQMCGIPVFHSRAHFLAFYNITEMEGNTAEFQQEMDEEFEKELWKDIK